MPWFLDTLWSSVQIIWLTLKLFQLFFNFAKTIAMWWFLDILWPFFQIIWLTPIVLQLFLNPAKTMRWFFRSLWSSVQIVRSTRKLFQLLFNLVKDIGGFPTDILHSEDECMDDEDPCLARKKKVDAYIQNAVLEGKSCRDVLHGVEKINESLDFRETQYVKDEYVDSCMRGFFENLNDHLEKKIILSDKCSFEKYVKCLEDINSVGDVGKYFSEVKHTSVIMHCEQENLLSKNKIYQFLKKVKKACSLKLFSTIDYLPAEKSFFNALNECIKLYLCNSVVPRGPIFNDELDIMADDHLIVQSLFQFLALSRDGMYQKLKSLLDIIGDTNACSEVFVKSVAEVLKESLTPPDPQFTTQLGHTIVAFKGWYVKLNHVAEKISGLEEKSYDGVQVYAHGLVVADSSLKWPGKNLEIVSPEVFVQGSIVLDVSGKDGKNVFSGQKADNGKLSGYDGKPGKHGSHGESGGNVRIISDIIQNSEQLVIRSNGGDGCDGQDGGDGRNGAFGEDGQNMSRSEFKKKFPKCTDLFDNESIQKNIANIVSKKILQHTSKGDKIHCTGQTAEGYETEICVCLGTSILAGVGYPTRQAFCLVKGSHGTPGKKGGDGGKGGNAGLGGYSGSVTVTDMQSQQSTMINVESDSGKDGKAGKDGKGGKGGRSGKKGIDHGRVDPNGVCKSKFYHGQLYLHMEYNQNPDNAWCEHKQTYFAIRHTSESNTKPEDGKTGYVSLNETQSSRTRKNAISTEHTMFTRNFYVETNFLEQFSGTLAADVSATSDSYETKIKKESLHVTLLMSSTIGKNSVIQSGLKSVAWLNIPNVHKQKRNNLTNHTPTVMRPANEQDANIINTCNKALTLDDWVQTINDLLTSVDNKSIKQDFNEDEMQADVEKNMKKFLCELRHFSIKAKNVSDLSSIGKKWKSLEKKLCKQLWEEIYCLLTANLRCTLINIMHTYIKDSIMRERDESNRAQLECMLLQDLYSFVADAQKTDKMADMDDLKKQHNHVDERIERFLKNTKLVNMIPFTADDDADDNALTSAARHIKQQSNESKEEKTEQSRSTPSMILSTLRWKEGMPEKVLKLMKMVSYLPDDDCTLLLVVVCDRLMTENLQIDRNIFQWLITRVIAEHDEHGLFDFIVLFAAKPQNTWLAQYMVLQLRDKLEATQDNLLLLQSKLLEHSSHQILLLLSQRLALLEPGNSVKPSDIIQILELSQNFEIDDLIAAQLQELSIPQWSYSLSWFLCLVEIECLKTNRNWKEGEVFQAASYMSQLKNMYGDSSVQSFLKMLQIKPEVHIPTLLLTLQKFSSNHWVFDNEAMNTLRDTPIKNWKLFFDDMYVQNKDRTVKELILLMKHDSNNSQTVVGKLDDLLAVVKAVNECDRNPSKILEPAEQICKFDGHLISRWAKCICEKRDPSARATYVNNNMVEVLAVVNQAITLIKEFSFSLRDTQKLSVAMFLKSASGSLLQVATGEGKSLIIATVAIVKALSGENVDVITSSSVLAERDAKLYADLYSLFGVKVGHNCSELVADRKAAYREMDVVYGTIGDFQRDILLDEFYDKDVGIGSREPGSVIVDEVDSLLLDKGQNLLYLSHTLPYMDLLEPVYVYIWNYVHSKSGMYGSNADVKYIKDCMIHAMYGILTEEELNFLFPKNAQCIWNQLLQLEMIGSDGRILIRSDIESYCHSGKAGGKLGKVQTLKVSTKEQEILLSYLKDKIRQGIMFEVPKYLKSFVDLHLSDWIETAFTARHMVQNDHYVIDCDRSESATSTSPNIVIMDNDTGVEQYHSQWSNGLHQFLQLKHGIRLSFEGLKAVFMSNVTLFARYGRKLFGLSGTLGSTRERDLLQSIYGIEYATVPSFRPSKFTEEMTVMCSTEDEWLDSIATSSKQIAENRPVLVICESVRDVEKLEKRLAGQQYLYIYKRTYEPLSVGNESPIDRGCIILATNLAGRGTDIQISERISNLGGMHVCLTYLPPNIRVEQQAFGRAGRKGQRGTGQLICHDISKSGDQHVDNILDVVKMKMKRNIEEERNIDQIQINYDSVTKVEESFFRQFHRAYKTVQQLKLKNEEKELQQIALQNCLDDWAFCLDNASHQDYVQRESIVQRLLSQINKASQTNEASRRIKRLRGLIKGPAHLIQLAKTYLKYKKYDEANKVLDELIANDETFSEIARYYKCHATKWGDDSDAKKSVISNLQTSEALIKKRCLSLSCYGEVISMISKSYTKQRESFLVADDYVKQKQDMINILQEFLTSIQKMLGYPLSPMMLQTAGIDLLQSHCIYNILLQKGVLDSATVYSNIEDRVWDELKDKYQSYFCELKSRINDYKNKSITPEILEQVLPSREEFWQVLIDAHVLIKEEKFVILDKERLKTQILSNSETVKAIVKHMENLQETGSFKKRFQDIEKADDRELDTSEVDDWSENVKDVCLYPEQIAEFKSDNVKVLLQKQFEENFGNLELWKTLLDEKILQVNRIAKFQYSESAKLSKYDGIHDKAFTVIDGIDFTMSREIYECLQDCTHESLHIVEEKLNKYWQYQTEIENIILKYFQYRKAFKNLVSSCHTGLESKPHEPLFQELVALHVIKPVSVNAKFKETEVTDTIVEQMMNFVKRVGKKPVTMSQLTQFYSGQKKEIVGDAKSDALWLGDKTLAGKTDLPPAVRVFLASIITQRENATSLSSNLKLWHSALEKYEHLKTNLTSLENTVDSKNQSMEIAIFKTNGFGDLVVLSEQKWTVATFLRTGAIVLLGLAQIALAILVEIGTSGTETNLTGTLLDEGLGDIIFAMKSVMSGHCSWESYLVRKKSIFKSAVESCTVAKIIFQGAKYSLYGYRLGLSHLRKLCSMDGFEQVVLNQKEIAAVRNIAQTIKPVAVGLTNGVIDNFVQQKLNDFYQTLSEKIIDRNKETIRSSELKKKMEELTQKVGATEAKQIMTQLMTESLSESVIYKITENIGQLGGSFSSDLHSAVTKFGNCRESQNAVYAKLACLLPKVLNVDRYSTKIDNIVSTVMTSTTSFISKVEERIKNSDSLPVAEQSQEDQPCSKMVDIWTDKITKQVESVLSKEIGKPILKQGAQTLLNYAGRQMKRQYFHFQEKTKRAEYEILKHEHNIAKQENLHDRDESVNEQLEKSYRNTLLHLLEKTRDHMLFADLVREGVPLGINYAQPVAELFQRPVAIKVIGDSNNMTIPPVFTPLSDNTEPICMSYKPGNCDSCGHFFSPLSGDKGTISSGFDCLLDAVSSQLELPLKREDIALEIEKNPKYTAGICKDSIKKGGASCTPSTIKEFEEEAENIGEAHLETEKDIQQKSINKDFNGKGDKFGNGNYEFLQLDEGHKTSKDQSPVSDLEGNPCNHWTQGLAGQHPINYLMVDSRYVIWKCDDGTLQGHDGALYNNQNAKLVKGKNSFHMQRTADIRETRSVGEAARVAIPSHLSGLIDPSELQNMNKHELSNTYTAHGHNMANSRQKTHFCKGYEREYYKIWLVGKKLNAKNLPSYKPPAWIPRDPKMKKIINKIENTKSLKDCGDVLMKPAPFG